MSTGPYGDQIMRVLCTGSRNWTDIAQIGSAIEAMANLAREQGKHIIFVHGDCPTGADHLVEKYCRTMGNYDTERHPADWKQNGKSAGPIRNREMVDLGADYCVAFAEFCVKSGCKREDHFTHGTRDCLKVAQYAHIPCKLIFSNTDERLF